MFTFFLWEKAREEGVSQRETSEKPKWSNKNTFATSTGTWIGPTPLHPSRH